MKSGDTIYYAPYGDGEIITVWPDGSVTARFDNPPGMVKTGRAQIVPVVQFVPERKP